MDESMHATPPTRVPRRVATAPIPLRQAMEAASPDSDLVETLYSHPNARIISFTASGRAVARSPGGASLSRDDAPGTLSWSSQLERTIAVELPVEDPEDQRRAEELRAVLDKILQFEKTACPFKRTFTVELPEQIPITIRPWTPATPAFDSGTSAFTRSRRSSSAARTSTPTPLSNRRRTNVSTSPMSSRPTSSASCAPVYSQLQVPKSEFRSQFQEALAKLPFGDYESDIDKFPQTAYLDKWSSAEPGSKSLEAVPERPAEQNSADPFFSTPSEAVSRSLSKSGNEGPEEAYVAGLGVRMEKFLSSPSRESCEILSHDEPSVFSSSPPQDEASAYELHEGTGYRGGRIKARLRRTAGFPVTRSATMPAHLMSSTFDKSSTREPSASRNNVLGSDSETLSGSSVRGTDAFHSAQKDNKMELRSPQPLHQQKPVEPPQLRRRESEESFHSIESWHSSTAPLHHSSPTSRPESPIEETQQHMQTNILSFTATKPRKLAHSGGSSPMPCAWESDTDEGNEVSDESVIKETGSSQEDDRVASLEIEDTALLASVMQRRAARNRATTSSISVRRRALSPLPPAANLFTPVNAAERQPYRSRLETVKKIPMAIITKTCEMIIGPPRHLIALMLKVAAKIAAGEWRGLVYGYNDNGEQIPVEWDYSEGEFSDWSDDEHYMGSHDEHHSKHKHHRHQTRQREHAPQEWGSVTNHIAPERPGSSDDSRSWGVD
ncbi:hypothetical protein F66182_10949 [Fusarium sp. NRRL 66182]|nr:hypothetical protein F66182_10949 [Fusarium sp. NRRL 66182]